MEAAMARAGTEAAGVVRDDGPDSRGLVSGRRAFESQGGFFYLGPDTAEDRPGEACFKPLDGDYSKTTWVLAPPPSPPPQSLDNASESSSNCSRAAPANVPVPVRRRMLSRCCSEVSTESRAASVNSNVNSNVSSLSESETSLASSNSIKNQPAKVMVGRTSQPQQISLSTLSSITKDENGNLLSMGTKLHGIGRCVPCKWMRSNRGCRDGVLCKLCHGDHANMTRHGMRNIVRRHGLQKRQMFEGGAHLLPADSVKNTFIHVHGEDGSTPEASDGGADPKRLTRSLSQGELVHSGTGAR